MMRRVRQLFVVLAAAAAAAAPGAAAATPIEPDAQAAVSIDRVTWEIGERMMVLGDGWPTGSVSLQVCGNNAVNGSLDCHMTTSRTQRVGADGSFQQPITIAAPPAPCPCVLTVRSLASGTVNLTPIRIPGHPTLDGVPAKDPGVGTTTLSVSLDVSGIRSLREYTGFGP
jgi:hypothetical protein